MPELECAATGQRWPDIRSQFVSPFVCEPIVSAIGSAPMFLAMAVLSGGVAVVLLSLAGPAPAQAKP